jgi:hypothetical protein
MVECKIKISDQDLKNALDPKHVMLAYTSLGGTAPEPTKRVLDNASATLKKIKSELEGDQPAERVSKPVRPERAFGRVERVEGGNEKLSRGRLAML